MDSWNLGGVMESWRRFSIFHHSMLGPGGVLRLALLDAGINGPGVHAGSVTIRVDTLPHHETDHVMSSSPCTPSWTSCPASKALSRQSPLRGRAATGESRRQPPPLLPPWRRPQSRQAAFAAARRRPPSAAAGPAAAAAAAAGSAAGVAAGVAAGSAAGAAAGGAVAMG
eukprot:364255-Chlamydomonas_euryale.AAC.11